MKYVTLTGHFDGEKICIDEPVKLKTNTKLMITVLTEETADEEHKVWFSLSAEGLENAYGEHEKGYSLSLIKEPNPDYKP